MYPGGAVANGVDDKRVARTLSAGQALQAAPQGRINYRVWHRLICSIAFQWQALNWPSGGQIGLIPLRRLEIHIPLIQSNLRRHCSPHTPRGSGHWLSVKTFVPLICLFVVHRLELGMVVIFMLAYRHAVVD